MSDVASSKSRIPASAWVSLGLGLASFGLCLLALTGVPAVLVGLRSLRSINGSEGTLKGARVAIGGMILGATASLLTLLGVAAILLLRLQAANQRMECSENLRQLGLALNKYADIRGRFPAATRGPASLAPTARASWIAEILPHLGEGTRQAAVYQRLSKAIDFDRAWEDSRNDEARQTRLRILHCPGQSVGLGNTTSYVGMAGVGNAAADLPRAAIEAGMFGYERGVRREEIVDGISFTMMVLETAHDNGPWIAGGAPTARGLAPEVEQYSGYERPFGGLHPGVVQILWVDGAVRPLSNDTPGAVFRAHATLRGE